MNPDCRDGKHAACRSDAWDFETDAPTACRCECHDLDLRRTRVNLARLQGDHERLAAQLAEAGLTSFVARSEWLIAHRTADERLAWKRRWRALGVTDPEPHAERFVRGSLAVVKPRRHRKKPEPIIPEDRQLEIAIAALAARKDAA